MLNRAMRRTVGAVTTLAVCGLLAACGGGDSEAGKRSLTDSASVTTDTAVTAASDSITVVFQMTGLMLAVPPKKEGGDGRTHVMLPVVGTHRARLGFGLRTNNPTLCASFEKRICYVDLERWSVDTIGIGGAPTDPHNTGIPRGALNVTRGAGGDYRAHPHAVQPMLRSHIIFAAGRATDSCSLGRWNYTPVNQQGQPTTQETLDLVNVLSWTIRYPGNSFTLRFIRKAAPVITIDVPLEGITDDSIMVVLAHVHRDELKYLPPADSGSATGSETSLKHVHDFYNLLRKSDGTQPSPNHRPVPIFVDSTGVDRCRVKITTPTDGLVPFTGRGGIKTYGCVVGSGEG